jgi:hypothetical protein
VTKRRAIRLALYAMATAVTVGTMWTLAWMAWQYPTPPFWEGAVTAVVGVGVASVLRYRLQHEFWPWDRKRRMIEKWRWLVEGSSGPDDA